MESQKKTEKRKDAPTPQTSTGSLSDQQKTTAEKMHLLNERIPTLDIFRPEVRFSLLKSFRDQGVFFISLKTGKRFLGLPGDKDIIGLVFEPQDDSQTTNIGFLNLDKNQSKERKDPETFEVDALLYFQYKDEDFNTGYIDVIGDKVVYLFYIEVWNDLCIDKWKQIIEKVIKDLTVDVNGQAVPQVKFHVKTLFVPDDPSKPSRMTLKIRKTPLYTNALSNDRINLDEEEDYEDKNKSPRPRL